MPIHEDDLLCCGGNCSGYKYLDEVEVACASGTVRGRTVQTCYGPQFVRFAGVPYAKPPVGPLRFLPPVPLRRWGNTIDATNLKPSSLSYNAVTGEIAGTEDCLYVTIQTVELEPREPLPVMVWIAGWCFCFDNHSYFGSGWLTNERVIVVHVSYRLGPFGFLSIRQATAPGNCGLKDVVVALSWIRANIASFGGDPNNVTIFGMASGASVVHYMMLSPLATGLYQKAIVQSGSALHNWALSYHPLDAAKALALELNVDTDDLHETVEALRALPAVEIMQAYATLMNRQESKSTFFRFDGIFKPCVEDEFEGQQAFLTKYPNYLLKSGRFNPVPLMIGSNTNQGKTIKLFEKLPLKRMLENMNVDLSTLVPRELGMEDCSTGSKNLGLRLIQFYVRDDKLTEQNMEDFYNFITDYFFNYYTNRCVKIHARHAARHSIYYFIIEALSDWTMPAPYEAMQDVGGELVFLFQTFSCAEYGGGGESSRIRQKIVRLWTNFAKWGNPTPDDNDNLLHVTWDPVVDPDRVKYLSIGQNLAKGCNPFYERMSFWDTVLDDTNYMRIAAFFDNLSSLTAKNIKDL